MNKSKIEWCDYTWNPVTGCKNGCWYCYASRISHRFGDSFEPARHISRLDEPRGVKYPAKIFVCSMADLFGNWVYKHWIQDIIDVAASNPQHIFQFLTKNPARYMEFDFPSNCWLGKTLTGKESMSPVVGLQDTSFISFEPLMGDKIEFGDMENWVIIGALSGPGSKKHQPKKEWIDRIVEQCRDYKIPVFMKSSLKDIWPGELIQEFSD